MGLSKDDGIALWDEVAHDWARFAESSEYRNLFLIPETLELLGDVEGKRILDLGCGEGGYARLLAGQGALVTAVDASLKLVGIAEKRARKEGLAITHLVRDAARLEFVGDASFDTVLAAMSLMDVEHYEEAIGEVRRVLKLGGNLLMSILHPCFSARACRWKKGRDGSLRYFIVDNYFDTAPWRELIHREAFKTPVVYRHRPLQDYMVPLLEAGFRLVRFHEPVPTQRQIEQSRLLARLARVPWFLFMDWRTASDQPK